MKRLICFSTIFVILVCAVIALRSITINKGHIDVTHVQYIVIPGTATAHSNAEDYEYIFPEGCADATGSGLCDQKEDE
jgi:hypothetical protein